jgi:hypothetical protein
LTGWTFLTDHLAIPTGSVNLDGINSTTGLQTGVLKKRGDVGLKCLFQ